MTLPPALQPAIERELRAEVARLAADLARLRDAHRTAVLHLAGLDLDGEDGRCVDRVREALRGG